MISKKMEPLVKNSSVIRAMFEEGAKMKARYGEDKVFDFSLGNPLSPRCIPPSPLTASRVA